jgi:hypothetical protein
MKTIILTLVLLSAVGVQAQTSTHCTTTPSGFGTTTDCTTKNTSSPGPLVAASNAVKANMPVREPLSEADLENIRAQRQRHFDQAQTQIADLRLIYAQHPTSFSKENLKAFNKARHEACKWEKQVQDPVSMILLLRDLDGTFRTCADAKHFK